MEPKLKEKTMVPNIPAVTEYWCKHKSKLRGRCPDCVEEQKKFRPIVVSKSPEKARKLVSIAKKQTVKEKQELAEKLGISQTLSKAEEKQSKQKKKKTKAKPESEPVKPDIVPE